MELPHILNELGFSEKEIKIYIILLTGGPSSVRRLSKEADINRGTTYDILKNLQKRGIVGMFQKHKKQFFAAEDPEKLGDLVERKEREIHMMKRHVAEALPELKSLYVHGGAKPVVKYYEGEKGISLILKDVLRVMSGMDCKVYRAYSSMALREYLYKEIPHFTKDRITREIHVNVIAIGSGGDEQPYSERRWLTQERGAPTYSIIYGTKVAFFSLDTHQSPIGVLIEDERIAETERMIFDHVWQTLEKVKSGSLRSERVRQGII